MNMNRLYHAVAPVLLFSFLTSSTACSSNPSGSGAGVSSGAPQNDSALDAGVTTAAQYTADINGTSDTFSLQSNSDGSLTYSDPSGNKTTIAPGDVTSDLQGSTGSFAFDGVSYSLSSIEYDAQGNVTSFTMTDPAGNPTEVTHIEASSEPGGTAQVGPIIIIVGIGLAALILLCGYSVITEMNLCATQATNFCRDCATYTCAGQGVQTCTQPSCTNGLQGSGSKSGTISGACSFNLTGGVCTCAPKPVGTGTATPTAN